MRKYRVKRYEYREPYTFKVKKNYVFERKIDAVKFMLNSYTRTYLYKHNGKIYKRIWSKYK